MNTFVVGDIHGAHKALVQCLELSQFNRKEDRLICLGDVCDRGKEVRECIDELLTIPNCVYILGNHDAWALEWATQGHPRQEWFNQGGMQTVASYHSIGGMPKAHIEFLSKALPWCIERNRLFVHGGFDPNRKLEETPTEFLIWDRALLDKAQQMEKAEPGHKFGPYEDIFIGHTPTINFHHTKPQKFCNVWAMDTGAGWGARLTIMNVVTKEFWQSKPVSWKGYAQF